ncbi:hypothetical protein BTA35_0207400 [Oceanospirillum linum]|uniref:DNA translocase FtsK n=1 Tax=Oceanospirillum linum TaxID=966 RepID=A0A1T1HDM6_OCELI|nr:hypothetical protein BTA35_0207400 [Oceanospirillum linum]
MRRGAREGVVILILALCSFLLLALISFNADDGGWSRSQSAGVTGNLMGRFGAYTSDLLLSLTGYSAYLFPLAMVYYAAHRIYLGRQQLDGVALGLRLLGFVVWICANATLASLHFYHAESALPSGPGGIIGEAFTSLFLASLGLMGATLLMLALWMVGFSLLTGWSWLLIMDAVGFYAESGAQRVYTWLKQEAKDSSAGLPEQFSAPSGDQLYSDRYQGQARTRSPSDTPPSGTALESDAFFAPVRDAYSGGQPQQEPSAPGVFEQNVAVGQKEPEFQNAYYESPPESVSEYDDGRSKLSAWRKRLLQSLPALPPLFRTNDGQVDRRSPIQERVEPGLSFDHPLIADDSLNASEPTLNMSSSLQQAFSHSPEPAPAPETSFSAEPDAAVAANGTHSAGEAEEIPLSATEQGEEKQPLPPVTNHGVVQDDEPSMDERLAAVTQTTEDGEIWSVARFQKPDTTPVGEITGNKPSIELLTQGDSVSKPSYTPEQLQTMSELLEVRLKEFNVVAQVVDVHPGPVITRFEIQPAAGVKASKITNLATDLARALAVTSVRVVEVIAGKSSVGIEIPNQNRAMIRLHKVLNHVSYSRSDSPLTLALGDDIAGQPVVANLAKMPHLLVAGTTGSGKSVGVNAMLLSMLFKATPEELRLIMVDPKMLELSVYDGIPHLLTPVVTDMKDAANALRWCVAEMERRYKLMAAMGVRNIAGFNSKLDEAAAQGARVADPTAKPEQGEAPPTLEKLPFIVVVIDEFADMMMIVGKKVEELIARLAQKARAAGIHLILATQRPSVDVITGLIKANIPTRIAFQVSSKIDSRTILDQGGAEQLLGHGDMLYLPPGTAMPVRVHGAFVDDDEVHRVVENWKRRGAPDYVDSILNGWEENGVPSEGGGADSGDEDRDALYDEVVEFITETRRVSASGIQRRFKIGYNRAARMVESLEAAGVVSGMGSNGQREVLAPPSQPQE